MRSTLFFFLRYSIILDTIVSKSNFRRRVSVAADSSLSIIWFNIVDAFGNLSLNLNVETLQHLCDNAILNKNKYILCIYNIINISHNMKKTMNKTRRKAMRSVRRRGSLRQKRAKMNKSLRGGARHIIEICN